MKILIVSEVSSLLLSLDHYLTERGFKVHTAKSKDEAIEVLHMTAGITVVISELSLRISNGVELYLSAQHVEHVNDAGRIPPPAFVFITAPPPFSTDAETRLLARANLLTGNNVMFKPLEKEELLARISRLTNKSTEVEPAADSTPEVAVPGQAAAALPQNRLLQMLQENQKRLEACFVNLERGHKRLSSHLNHLSERLEKLEKATANLQ